MSSNSLRGLKLGFGNVMLVGETLQAFLIRRRFTLTKFTEKPEPEFHTELWLTGEIQTWANSGELEKNGFRITANTIIENDPVQVDAEPKPGGFVKLDISFENQFVYIAICRPDGKAETVYLIVPK